MNQRSSKGIINREKQLHGTEVQGDDIAALKLKNEELTALLNAINKSQGMIEFDMSGNILHANDNFLQTIGYSLEEIRGKHHSMLVDPRYKDNSEYRLFWSKLNSGEFQAGEFLRIGKNDKEVWLLAAYNPILDLNGKPFKVVKFATDITKQKLEIEENGNKIKSEMNKAINSLNQQNKLKGAIEELTNSIRGELTISELGANLLRKIAQLIDIQVGVFYFLNKNKLGLISSYAYKIRKNLSNEFEIGEGLVGQCALEKKTIVLTHVPNDYIKINSGLGETSPDTIMVIPIQFENKLLGVIEIGKIGQFTEHDLNFLENSNETIGITLNSAIAREQMNKLLEESKKQSLELQAQQEELRSINEELQSQQDRLKDSNEELVKQSEVLKKSEEKIRLKNDELREKTESLEQQAREIETARKEIEVKAKDLEIASKYKSEFLANMSHELRTPLNSLLILSKLLSDNEEQNLKPEQVEAASVIHSSGKDLLNLINDILDLSKVEAGKLQIQIENVKVGTIVGNLRKQFDPIAKNKGIQFKEEYGEGAQQSLVTTDCQRVEQVLKNFLSNAFKFTSRGSVTLRVHDPDPSTTFKQPKLNPRNCIAFSVIDTGIGIPKDKQNVIFEAFQQGDGSTSRKYGGTGLGLSISRELAKLLHCEVQMHSQVNEGSTFTLYIPKSLAPHLNDRSDTDSGEHTFLKRTTTPFDPVSCAMVNNEIEENSLSTHPLLSDDRHSIEKHDQSLLIIEDDVSFAKILMNSARKYGYKCIVAHNGKEGLSLAKRYAPKGITLDIKLPDMEGRNILEQLNDEITTCHIPVHIISADDDQFLSLEKGAIGHLIKPATEKELEKAFAKITDTHNKEIKNILIIEDSNIEQDNLLRLIQNKSISITGVKTGKEGFQQLQNKNFDCMILDLNLPDTSGLELLQKLKNTTSISLPPIIIYSAKDLTKQEYQELSEYTSSFIVKGIDSHQRLLDELSLFLYTLKPKQQDLNDETTQSSSSDSFNLSLEGKKVLLVDDDMRNIFALSNALRKKGVNVVIADNGVTALEKLENEPGIEMIIMDIMMPIMDGYEAMGKIRKLDQFKGVPIIALTAKTLPEDKSKALEAGANDFLTKPVDFDKLLSLMKVWLSQTLPAER